MKKWKQAGIIFAMVLAANLTADAQMFWNQAAYFAGNNTSYIRVRNSAEINLTGSFTLEAWIKPEAMPLSRGIFGKGATLGTSLEYGMRLTAAGRISLSTNGSQRLISRSSSPVPDGQWTHVCGTYNSSTGLFRIFINGESDTSATVLAAAPPSNTDSLFIGISGSTTPFKGLMDEVRIWNRDITLSEARAYFRTSLGASSGIYSGLVYSLTFQQNEADGSVYTLFDWSGNGNGTASRNVADSSFTGLPSETIAINDCLDLDGSGDYVAAADDPELSPTTQLTLSCWIYPRSNSNAVLIHKGASSGGAGTNYRLGLFNGRLIASINGNFGFNSNDTIPLNRWTHVAFAYQGSTGAYYFYTNGKLTTLGANNQGNITDGTDSLYIGGTPVLLQYDGYIDEVKLIKDVKFEETIAQTMFRASEQSLGDASAVYPFDGYSHSSYDASPVLHFRNNASFGHGGSTNNTPVSPMNRSDVSQFEEGFHLRTSARRIPETGTSGLMIDDTLSILMNETISDIDVFIAATHNFEGDLQISLISPNGTQTTLSSSVSLVFNSDNFVTIFDDQAPSSLAIEKYVQFSPRIRAASNINPVFAGQNTSGNWRLRINDAVASDTGRLIAWGLRFNNRSVKPYMLGVRQFIQGFYRSNTNTMIRDTMSYYLRNTASPYAIGDSARAYVLNSGAALISPTNISSGAFYFLEVRHRNLIRTWSQVIKLDALTFQLSYDFTGSPAAAYGNNQVLVDNLPAYYGMYNADVNQDDGVDVTDLLRIDNEAFNFTTGYVATDVTGDNNVDVSDLVVADNNAANFVQSVVPGPEPISPYPESLRPDAFMPLDSDPMIFSGKSVIESGNRRSERTEEQRK